MITRRTFVSTLATAAAARLPGTALAGPDAWAVQPPAGRRGIKLGFDHFSLRGFGWKAGGLIDYAATLGIDALFLSELNVFEQRDETYLKGVKAKADAAGLALYVGMGSICPSSGTFDAKAGTAVDQVRDAIRIARTLGSPVLRCFLGRFDDRLKEGGIEGHIRNTVEVCKSVRGFAVDNGITLAVENHAGDMQAWELAGLVEAAGPDFVGVNLDPGNATWTMEDPVASLETLAAYVACTSIRDSALWRTPEGAMVQWMAMGEGDVDFARWVEIFASRTKGVPVFVETISGLARPFAVLTPEFWKPWPKARAQDLARWLAIADRGKPRTPFKPPEGAAERRAAEQAYQKAELEKSLAYCKKSLGRGLRS
jgi:sugar phosphate isomerase/epimerase